jgi:hypothetical protein
LKESFERGNRVVDVGVSQQVGFVEGVHGRQPLLVEIPEQLGEQPPPRGSVAVERALAPHAVAPVPADTVDELAYLLPGEAQPARGVVVIGGLYVMDDDNELGGFGFTGALLQRRVVALALSRTEARVDLVLRPQPRHQVVGRRTRFEQEVRLAPGHDLNLRLDDETVAGGQARELEQARRQLVATRQHRREQLGELVLDAVLARMTGRRLQQRGERTRHA